jgi:RNA polymerase sigma-70 factor (ECF subfamily)
MRHVLVDYGRARKAKKRGGGWEQVPLESVSVAVGDTDIDFTELDEALRKLEDHDPRMARIVEMHFFGGMLFEDIARELDLAPRTVRRDWNVARTLLLEELGGDQT